MRYILIRIGETHAGPLRQAARAYGNAWHGNYGFLRYFRLFAELGCNSWDAVLAKVFQVFSHDLCLFLEIVRIILLQSCIKQFFGGALQCCGQPAERFRSNSLTDLFKIHDARAAAAHPPRHFGAGEAQFIAASDQLGP